ncbi:MAG: nucleotidyltransferase family protein [Firmicutes bacterium]|nr:nucleotidyltransferase family protein [Bacillota bacterium]
MVILSLVINLNKIGIICEYNPFHNGHIHHIHEIKKREPNSIIILVLNGYFLERGEISTISKFSKTQIALNNNVDLVIELPALFGTQSADTFAYTSVYLLNKLKVQKIIFGSETNDINKIITIAKESQTKEYSEEIKKLLNNGVNYPTALAKSLKTKFTFLPNDLLGISYVKAILKINDKIIPETIQRTNSYLDTQSSENIVSASNIRYKLKNHEDISNYLPKEAKEKMNIIDYDLYFKILKSTILTNTHLNEILDVEEGIEFRLKEAALKTNNLEDFINYVKTKRYTYNKINRMLIHILLGIKKIHAKTEIDYLRILGLNKRGRDYLNSIKKDLDISVNINKSSVIYNYEIKASTIYDLLTSQNTYEEELNNKPIIH